MSSARNWSRSRRVVNTGALVLALGLSGIACKKSAPPATPANEAEAEIPALTMDQVAEGIEQKTLTVIDNNSRERFQKSHVPTAKWVSFLDVKASDLPASKDSRLVFYCANEH